MRVVFAFTAHVGHTNPTLPMVRRLVDLGHEVHYMCFESARERIENVGGIFHSVVDIMPEYYGKYEISGPQGATEDVIGKHGLDKNAYLSMMKVLNIILELELPGAIRFLKQLKPDVVVYDPLVLVRYAPYAAHLLGIPAVGVLTIAGPGAFRSHSPSSMPVGIAEADQLVQQFDPHVRATARLAADYGLKLKAGIIAPDGFLDACLSNVVITSTSKSLQDPMTPELAKEYQQTGARFVFVGPLLKEPPADLQAASVIIDPVLAQVHGARQQGRSVVIISMGTVVTSNHAFFGWDAYAGSSLCGRELCRAAWAGTFDAFRADTPDQGVFMICALGLQSDALGPVTVPPNAVCVPFFAQVDILSVGADLFVTHGGQNSFTEAMAYGCPVVVLPGFGDQVVNAQKAVDLGVGLKVDRPTSKDPNDEVASLYRREVCNAVQSVLSTPSFKQVAERQQEELRTAGGVPYAVELVLSHTKAAIGGA